MSRMNDASHRVINIKKLTNPHDEKQQGNEQNDQLSQVDATLKIEQLKQQIADLEQQKENILSDLRVSIKQEKETWANEKEIERQKAKQQGYETGYQEGAAQARNEWEASLEQVNQLTNQANEDYFRTIEKHEDAILQLAIASADKIIDARLDEDRTKFVEIIKGAIAELQDYAYIHIYVHPDEYENVVKQKAELEQIVGTKDLISVYIDQDLNDKACIIKHPNGQLDASIDLQLRQIKNVLAEKVLEQS